MMLVEDGKASLDKPVRGVDSNFAVMDPEATELMSLEDLLCQRTGIPRHDPLWYLSGWSASELYQRLRFLEPDPNMGFHFRQHFQYNNNLYAAAGTILEKLVQKAWSSLVAERILEPLGMNGSSSEFGKHAARLAKPYYQTRLIKPKNYANIAPAAALSSTLDDMASWLRLFVRGGDTGDGKRLLSEGGVEALLTNRYSQRAGYGLGWHVEEWTESTRIAWHGGSADGYSSWVSLLPDEGFGIVALSNQHMSGFPQQVALKLYCYLCGRTPPTDDPEQRQSVPIVQPPPRHASEACETCDRHLCGTYESAAYGTIRISEANGALRARYFDHDWPVRKTDAGGYQIVMEIFGMSYPVQALFIDSPVDGNCLALPWEPRVGWLRFRKRPWN